MKILMLLLGKELRCLWRGKQFLVAIGGFALLLVVLASFSFRYVGYGQPEMKELTPGILWLIFCFVGVISLNHSFSYEYKESALFGVMHTGVPAELVYLSKYAANYLVLFSIQLVVVVMHSVLFGVDYFSVLGPLILLTGLVAVGFVSLGTLLAAMATRTSGEDLLLPLILYPLALPLIAGGVFLSRDLLLNQRLLWEDFWFSLVICYDIIAFVSAMILFEFTSQE